ncbi:beta/gamma crystallin-related protein [bacterium]|nr:beta/gamma crystallin-related protein [bacterium]
MKLARTFVFLFAVLAVSAFVYAEDPYRTGFLDGIKHGLVDKASGSDFNYANDLSYQAGISNRSETNAEYRAGYRDGYTEGYKKDVGDQQAAEFTSDADAYKFGSDQGYNHGQIDSQTGRDFNYRRNPHFESGMTFDTYRDENYRAGYKEGYEQAYTEHPRNSELQIQVIPSEQKPTGSVRIFSDTGYGGQMERLSLGRYPYLEDWKNEIESVQVNGNVRVILFDKNNFQGQSIVLEENSPNLDAFNFNRRAASMMIVRIAE